MSIAKINENTEIDDIRIISDFKGISFSNFKKTDVKKELLTSLINSKIEPACYWCAELICAGHYNDIWEIVILFYSKYIHLGNPKIASYIELKINKFKKIVNNGYETNELSMRNNENIRRHFCEIMCILCDAKRKHFYNDIKVKKDDMDITNIKDKFKAPNRYYIEDIIKSEDPKELIIAINELSYSISDESKDIISACYWFEWILEFESICKKKKEVIRCARRYFLLKLVENKYQLDVIWIIWDIFLNRAENIELPIIKKIIESLLVLFCLKYTSGCIRKRKYIMYFAMALFCEKVTFEEEIIRSEQKEVVQNILNKKDLIFKQIKSNEMSSNTHYLFKDDKSRNLEKTIEKLEKMNVFGETFVPRL
jgi:hypothetical protein